MPTLGQVLRSPGLDLCMVVDAGGDPTVRWVAVSELADPTPFLEGGEIVLTTGLATAGWDDEWAAYAARLAAAGVAALGFGLGLTHARVPHGLHEAAQAADLTVFTVPRPVPFVAVTRTVARLVQQEEEQALRAALAVQRRLARDQVGRVFTARPSVAVFDRPGWPSSEAEVIGIRRGARSPGGPICPLVRCLHPSGFLVDAAVPRRVGWVKGAAGIAQRRRSRP
jgi:Purine catabolism regulatory protein-like family